MCVADSITRISASPPGQPKSWDLLELALPGLLHCHVATVFDNRRKKAASRFCIGFIFTVVGTCWAHRCFTFWSFVSSNSPEDQKAQDQVDHVLPEKKWMHRPVAVDKSRQSYTVISFRFISFQAPLRAHFLVHRKGHCPGVPAVPQLEGKQHDTGEQKPPKLLSWFQHISTISCYFNGFRSTSPILTPPYPSLMAQSCTPLWPTRPVSRPWYCCVRNPTRWNTSFAR